MVPAGTALSEEERIEIYLKHDTYWPDRHTPARIGISHHVRGLIGKWLLAYAEGMGDVFKALADPTRRKILDELADRDGQTLFEICNRLIMRHQISSSRQAISQHLDLLEAAGLVHTRRDGRYKFHYLDTAPLDRIAERWRRKEKK